MISHESVSNEKKNQYINIALSEAYHLKCLLNDFFNCQWLNQISINITNEELMVVGNNLQ